MIGNRPTVPDDVEFLWRMLYYASHSDEEPGVGPDDIRSNPDLVGYIHGWESADHVGVIAERDSTPLGAAWLRLLGPDEASNPVFVDREVPELALAVEPEWQGRGIGTTIMRDLLERAAEAYPAVVLSARADNRAVSLYERFGFVVVGQITNRVGTGSVKMVNRL